MNGGKNEKVGCSDMRSKFEALFQSILTDHFRVYKEKNSLHKRVIEKGIL